MFNKGAVRKRFRQKREPVGFRQKNNQNHFYPEMTALVKLLFLVFFFWGNSDKVLEFRQSCQNSDKVSANFF